MNIFLIIGLAIPCTMVLAYLGVVFVSWAISFADDHDFGTVAGLLLLAAPALFISAICLMIGLIMHFRG